MNIADFISPGQLLCYSAVLLIGIGLGKTADSLCVQLLNKLSERVSEWRWYRAHPEHADEVRKIRAAQKERDIQDYIERASESKKTPTYNADAGYH